MSKPQIPEQINRLVVSLFLELSPLSNVHHSVRYPSVDLVSLMNVIIHQVIVVLLHV
jgi:hypothetical protein